MEKSFTTKQRIAIYKKALDMVIDKWANRGFTPSGMCIILREILRTPGKFFVDETLEWTQVDKYLPEFEKFAEEAGTKIINGEVYNFYPQASWFKDFGDNGISYDYDQNAEELKYIARQLILEFSIMDAKNKL